MSEANRTIDHEIIRRWAEERGGRPAHVKGTEVGDDPGILRIEFRAHPTEEKLEPIPWEKWFEWFERKKLTFLHDDDPNNRFHKLVRRTPEDEALKAAAAGPKISVNHATVEELDALYGVGLRNAQKIVEFRSRERAFHRPEDLEAVEGIDGELARLIARQATFE
jgi:competence ComEA-like helix-hairpin-helix protein